MKMETSAKLYSLNYSNVKTYLFALLFVAGNIALPQLCHLVPYGGPTLLPIYFFTLIAAYKYGFRVGLLTAVLSPVINHVLFAMPSEAVLPIILSYQLIGTAFEWMIEGDFYIAVQDFRIGIPGMLIQWFGGYALLKAIAKL